MNKITFANDTIEHRSRVTLLCGKVITDCLYNVVRHDQDKLEFIEHISPSDDILKLWKCLPEGYCEHKSDRTKYSKHHKENVDSLAGFVEMLCDWVDACCSRRQTTSSDAPVTINVIEKWIDTINHLDWISIISNLLHDYEKLMMEAKNGNVIDK